MQSYFIFLNTDWYICAINLLVLLSVFNEKKMCCQFAGFFKLGTIIQRNLKCERLISHLISGLMRLLRNYAFRLVYC